MSNIKTRSQKNNWKSESVVRTCELYKNKPNDLPVIYDFELVYKEQISNKEEKSNKLFESQKQTQVKQIKEVVKVTMKDIYDVFLNFTSHLPKQQNSADIDQLLKDVHHLSQTVLLYTNFALIKHKENKYEIAFPQDRKDLNLLKSNIYGDLKVTRIGFIIDDEGNITVLSFYFIPTNGLFDNRTISWNKYKNLKKIVLNHCPIISDNFFPPPSGYLYSFFSMLKLISKEETIYDTLTHLVLLNCEINKAFIKQTKYFKNLKIENIGTTEIICYASHLK